MLNLWDMYQHVADLDPITPNMLLMGRQDSSLLQTLYDNEDLLGKRGRARCWQITSKHHTCQAWVIRSDGKELTVGQVVLVIDSWLPRALWPSGHSDWDLLRARQLSAFSYCEGQGHDLYTSSHSDWFSYLSLLKRLRTPQAVFLSDR